MSRHLADESPATSALELLEDSLCRAWGRRAPLPGFGKHRAVTNETEAAK